ncbi:MAG: class I SAM-dependent methyltransferase [Candidatus Thermoplasmatota archaeon]|jgi:2-polyprenyl-6-hydroxyphenyl methylase/3-demethylubiquinone-9 3-methyltransferase|nr:class I SAM-dependent methyltransferase [Candidatus Thermoplasmatota archaeon]
MNSDKKYYDEKLSANKLKSCYEIAPPRILQYLEAEVNHVLQKINPGDSVLELGCGYGRILPQLAQKADIVVGIDTSLQSLALAKETIQDFQNCYLVGMDAIQLAFANQIFDVVVCIQNGISAFHVDKADLIRESIRVTKPGGIVLFSSYSGKFWPHRLHWFQLQSDAGLIGEIDSEKTRDGVIVCKDGFTATTVSKKQFKTLTQRFNVKTNIVEVDESSLFCEIHP